MKVIVIGSTGLVGSHFVELALKNDLITEVHCFARRELDLASPKLIQTMVDFDDIDKWGSEIKGDILFSALGTTLKQAGSKEAQYRVDHDYQLKAVRFAIKNNVKTFGLISSTGADARASFFYLKMKGELENEVSTLPFKSINIFRPGPLSGEREVSRFSEKFSLGILSKLPKSFVPPHWTPVSGEHVAKFALAKTLESYPGKQVYEAQDILNG